MLQRCRQISALTAAIIASPRDRADANRCMHGKDAIIEELLDWRPFDYFTVSTLLPIPGAPKLVMTRASGSARPTSDIRAC
jgi:hypothetical protein